MFIGVFLITTSTFWHLLTLSQLGKCGAQPCAAAPHTNFVDYRLLRLKILDVRGLWQVTIDTNCRAVSDEVICKGKIV